MAIELNKLILSRYIVSRHLASGGMADVYEAQDIVINKIVALKFLKEKLLDDDDAIEQFKNEARYTAIFNHPHIMRIYNVGVYGKQPFVSYEILKGKSLKEVLDNRGKLSFDESINFMLQILDGVNHMHEREVLHNDLKPDNIFLLSDGNIKSCDLGISTHAFDREKKELLGTLNYLAPEVLQNKKYSYQSDIYSLGIMLFEFITGRIPFLGVTSKEIIESHFNEDIPSIKKYTTLPNVDDLDYVISKACNSVITNRYKSVKEFINDLTKIKRHEKLKKGNFFTRLFK